VQLQLSICLSVYLSVYLFVFLFIYLSIYLSFYLSIYLQVWKRSYSARLPQFLNFTTSKRKPFARLPQFSKLTTSKTKQFCETSFKNGKLSAELTASLQSFSGFPIDLSIKYCACQEKVMPGHTKCCTCHAKSSSQNWRSDAPKCNPSQEISARTS